MPRAAPAIAPLATAWLCVVVVAVTAIMTRGARATATNDDRIPVDVPAFEVLGKALPCVAGKAFITYRSTTFYNDDVARACLSPREHQTKGDDARTIFVVGDSHATNHVPSLQHAAKNITSANLEVRYIQDNESFLKLFLGIEGVRYNVPLYMDVFDEHMRAGDLMVFSFFRGRISEGEYKATYVLPRLADGAKLRAVRRGLEELNAIVKSKNATLVLVDDVPFTCESGVDYDEAVLRGVDRSLCETPAGVSREDRRGLTDLYRAMERKEPNVMYADFHDALCDDRGVCGAFDARGAGQPRLLYGDTAHHFTTLHPAPLAEEWRALLEGTILPGTMQRIVGDAPHSAETLAFRSEAAALNLDR